MKKEQYSPEVMSDKRQMPGNKEVDNRSREIIKTIMEYKMYASALW